VRGSDFLGNLSVAEGSAIRHRHISPEPTEPPFLTIEACLIRGNQSTQLGAAVRAFPASPPTMSVAATEICDNIGLNLEGPFTNLGGNLICNCPADVNLDGSVDANDLAFILGFWGPCPAPCGADIDRDASVDANDLALVLGAWGLCP
jgi:hypothetical protein